jgi:hypothetical protein
MRRPAILTALAVTAIVFVIANVHAARRFWFWWDEISIIDAHSKPFKGIFVGHQGNWFPLGRLFFYLETQLFGSAYQWYVAVNAILVLAIAALLVDILRRIPNSEGSPHRWIRLGVIGIAVILYVTATGNLYDIQWGFMAAWFLSVLAMLIGVWIIQRRDLSPIALMIPMVMSFLFFASNTITVSLLGIALLTVTMSEERRSNRIGPVRWEIVIIGSAAILFLAGTQLARAIESSDLGARSSPIAFSDLADRPGLAFSLLAAGITVWMITPVSLVLQHSNPMFNAAGWWLQRHVPISLASIAGLAGLGAWILRGRDAIRDRFRLAVLLVVVGIAAFQTMTTIRGFPLMITNFGRRYDPSLMLLVILAWTLLALAPTTGRSARVLQRLAAALLAATAVVSLITLPREIRVASYPPRIGEAESVARALAACTPGTRFPDFQSVPPDLLEVVCDRYERINR